MSSKIYRTIDAPFIESVCEKLKKNQKVHRRLPQKGLLHIDRRLPFLVIYRLSKESPDYNTARLLKSEASYFIIPASIAKARVSVLIKRLVQELQARFRAFLLLEIWADSDLGEQAEIESPLTPIFNIYADTSGELVSTCQRLRQALLNVNVQKQSAFAQIKYHRKTRPPGLPPILSKKILLDLNCHAMGIALNPVYSEPETGELYPLVFKKYHADFSYALKHAFYEFSQSISKHNPEHYHALGSNAVNKLTYKIDHQLAALSAKIDFLLWVTPTNTEASYKKFKRSDYEKIPFLNYRPLPVDPAHLKQQLYSIDIRKVHDPTIQAIFEEKRAEMDRQLTMLLEMNTKNFMLSSIQLYGAIEPALFDLAVSILKVSRGRRSDDTYTGKHDAHDFADIARKEIRKICQRSNIAHKPDVIITDDVPGLMVNKGHLLVGRTVRVPNNRIQALLQHEVGTHIVSYMNGCHQPLKLFSFGLPGYDETQEGLAVLAEYLVGQLSIARIKMLAGRVVAAKLCQEGANLKEIFFELIERYAFDAKTAYRIALRVMRGGGLLKDAIYLRGFNNLIKYLQAYGDFNVLFVGKFAQDQIPVVQELLYRGILKHPPILPIYLEDPKVQKRLSRLRQGLSIIDILESKR